MSFSFNKQNSEEYFIWSLLVAKLSQGHIFIDFVPKDGVIRQDRLQEDRRSGDVIESLVQRTLEDSLIVRLSCDAQLTSEKLSFTLASAISERRRRQEWESSHPSNRIRSRNPSRNEGNRTNRPRMAMDKLNVRKTPSNTKRIDRIRVSHQFDFNTAEQQSSNGKQANPENVWTFSTPKNGKFEPRKQLGEQPPWKSATSMKYNPENKFNALGHSQDYGNLAQHKEDKHQNGSNLGSRSPVKKLYTTTDETVTELDSYVLILDSIDQAPEQTILALQEIIKLKSFYVPYFEPEGDVNQMKAVSYLKALLPEKITVIATSSACCIPVYGSIQISKTMGIRKLPVAFWESFLLRIPLQAHQLFVSSTFDAEVESMKFAPGRKRGTTAWLQSAKLFTRNELAALSSNVKSGYVSPDLQYYLRDMISSLRMHPLVKHGPLNSFALERLERAVVSAAIIDGRKFGIPFDLMNVVVETLSHLIVIEDNSRGKFLSNEQEPPACFIEPPKEWHPLASARFVVHQALEFYLPIVR